jgi:HNH endonuclease
MQYDDKRARALNYIINNSIMTTDGCREWQGPLTKQGYGQIGPTWIIEEFGIKGIHRLLAHLITGEEFTGRHQQVLHSCDNRRCCNGEHLRIGTAAENTAEMMARGRGRDVLMCLSKLSHDEVREIRRLRDANVPSHVIAEEYCLSRQHVWRIGARKVWRTLP